MSERELCLTDRHQEELHRSGLTDVTIAAAGIRSVSGAEASRLLNWKEPAPSGGWAVQSSNGFCQVKLDQPRQKNGKTIKYETPVGSALHVFLGPGFDPTSPEDFFTEGVKKKLALQQYGFNAIGLQGVWCWQQRRLRTDAGRAYGTRMLIVDLASISWAGKRVYIVFDSDAADNVLVRLAEAKLGEVLAKLGATVRVVRIPPDGDAKVGVDDFIVRHGVEAFKGLIATAEPAELPPPPTEMELARELIAEKYTAKDGARAIRWWRDEPYVYAGANYAVQPEAELVSEVMLWLDDHGLSAKHRRAQDVVRALAAESLVPGSLELPLLIPDDGPPQASRFLGMQNGLLDVEAFLAGKAEVLFPHSPRHFAVVAMPYPFDLDAKCDRWLRFLDEALEGDQEQITLLQQWFGLNLVYEVSFQRFLILFGEGATGKSVVLFVLEAVLGSPNVSHVSLELFGSRFQLWPTIGKLANIAAEVSDLARPDEAVFKAFVSGDVISVDRKNLPVLQVRPTARVTIATNTLPRWSDRSNGIWRRQLVIPFNRVVPLDRQDRHLASRIIAEELPGIFLWALVGLDALRRDGSFVEPETCREVSAEHRLQTNPAREFLLESCEPSPSAEVRSDHLYAAYVRWSEQNGCRPLNSRHFGQELRRAFGDLDRKQRRDGQERHWVLCGLWWRDNCN